MSDLVDVVALEADDFVAVVHLESHEQKNEKSITSENKLTVKAANYRLLGRPLLHDDLDMRVLACDVLDVFVDVGAEGRGGGPDVAVLKDELADGGDEGCVSVCGLCCELSPGAGDGGDGQAGHGGRWGSVAQRNGR